MTEPAPAPRTVDVRVGSSTDALTPISSAERSLAARASQWAGLGAVVFAAVAADQLTKWIVSSQLSLDESLHVLGPFSIHHVQNSGIAFGLFASATPLVTALTALAVGLWLSALNVQYRDVRYTTNFLIQFWLFATPVAYPSSIVPTQWRVLYGLNPMVGVVEGFRWCLLGHRESPNALVLVSAVVVSVLLVGGLFYFRRMEQEFSDVV